MRRRLGALALGATLAASGCGDPPGQGPSFNKTVPEIEALFQGRALETWRALDAHLPAEVRAQTAYALAELEKDPAEGTPLLLRLLEDPEPSVQLAAIVAAGRMGLESMEVAQRLVLALESPYEALRRHARKSLAQGGAGTLPALEGALAHPHPQVRWAAAAALSGLGKTGAPLAALLARLVLEDPESLVRRQALLSVARLGPAGVQTCIGHLRSDDLARRQEAAAALVGAGADAVAPLATLLADPDAELAAVAAGVLVDLGEVAAPALDALLGALSRPGPVRFNSADALVAVGAPAVPGLEALAESPDEAIAAVARYTLERIPR